MTGDVARATFAIFGTVGGVTVDVRGIDTALEALTKYREFVATGDVGSLRVCYGERQIAMEDLRQMAGKR